MPYIIILCVCIGMTDYFKALKKNCQNKSLQNILLIFSCMEGSPLSISNSRQVEGMMAFPCSSSCFGNYLFICYNVYLSYFIYTNGTDKWWKHKCTDWKIRTFAGELLLLIYWHASPQIKCTTCILWFHWLCVGRPPLGQDFYCPACTL